MQLYWKSNKSYLFPESNISHESGQKISIFPSFHFILLLFILRLFCLLQIASYFPKFAWHHYLNTNQLNICKRGKRFLENTFNDLIIFRTLNGSNKELTIDVQIKVYLVTNLKSLRLYVAPMYVWQISDSKGNW